MVCQTKGFMDSGLDPKQRSIYLAGKVEFSYSHDGLNDWRGSIATDENRLYCDLDSLPSNPPVVNNAFEICGTKYALTGPFFCDNTSGHGSYNKYNQRAPHGAGISENIPMRSMIGIKRADLVFAWIPDLTCYGTLAEIGYAVALGKEVVTCGPDWYPDLWFIYELSDRFIQASTPLEGLKINEMIYRKV